MHLLFGVHDSIIIFYSFKCNFCLAHLFLNHFINVKLNDIF